ncbi:MULTISPECIES: BadF/BadG/BcrA/BcrD ATPase family protein [unclassified Roseibium]
MAVDGGGTGCRARLETADGTVLGRGLAGPAATRIGFEASWEAIRTAYSNAFSEAGMSPAEAPPVHAGIGVAGFKRPGAAQALAAQPHPFASLQFAGDSQIACLGAHNGADGAIVIIGTGSCGLSCVDGKWVQVGGYGFPISDEGSGAFLGLCAIQSALQAYDGRQQKSALLTDVLNRFDHDPLKVVSWMDSATATDYASYAPIVVRHVDDGEPAARRIMQSAAAKIDLICRALLETGAPRLSLIGGLASVIETWLAPDLRRRLKPPLGDPLDGASLLAGRPAMLSE